MTDQRPRKYFGQHFLHDQNIVDKIIAAIVPKSDQHFVEIGPGRGALTRPLIDLCKRIAAGIKAHLGQDNIETKFVALSSDEKLSAVRDGKVDIECGATDERGQPGH